MEQTQTPGSCAPEPSACGREMAARKDQTLPTFLSQAPPQTERKTSKVLHAGGWSSLPARLSQPAVLFPEGGFQGMSSSFGLSSPRHLCHLGMLVQVEHTKLARTLQASAKEQLPPFLLPLLAHRAVSTVDIEVAALCRPPSPNPGSFSPQHPDGLN